VLLLTNDSKQVTVNYSRCCHSIMQSNLHCTVAKFTSTVPFWRFLPNDIDAGFVKLSIPELKCHQLFLKIEINFLCSLTRLFEQFTWCWNCWRLNSHRHIGTLCISSTATLSFKTDFSVNADNHRINLVKPRMSVNFTVSHYHPGLTFQSFSGMKEWYRLCNLRLWLHRAQLTKADVRHYYSSE